MASAAGLGTSRFSVAIMALLMVCSLEVYYISLIPPEMTFRTLLISPLVVTVNAFCVISLHMVAMIKNDDRFPVSRFWQLDCCIPLMRHLCCGNAVATLTPDGGSSSSSELSILLLVAVLTEEMHHSHPGQSGVAFTALFLLLGIDIRVVAGVTPRPSLCVIITEFHGMLEGARVGINHLLTETALSLDIVAFRARNRPAIPLMTCNTEFMEMP